MHFYRVIWAESQWANLLRVLVRYWAHANPSSTTRQIARNIQEFEWDFIVIIDKKRK